MLLCIIYNIHVHVVFSFYSPFVCEGFVISSKILCFNCSLCLLIEPVLFILHAPFTLAHCVMVGMLHFTDRYWSSAIPLLNDSGTAFCPVMLCYYGDVDGCQSLHAHCQPKLSCVI